jgi:hypothetical protein
MTDGSQYELGVLCRRDNTPIKFLSYYPLDENEDRRDWKDRQEAAMYRERGFQTQLTPVPGRKGYYLLQYKEESGYLANFSKAKCLPGIGAFVVVHTISVLMIRGQVIISIIEEHQG